MQHLLWLEWVVFLFIAESFLHGSLVASRAVERATHAHICSLGSATLQTLHTEGWSALALLFHAQRGSWLLCRPPPSSGQKSNFHPIIQLMSSHIWPCFWEEQEDFSTWPVPSSLAWMEGILQCPLFCQGWFQVDFRPLPPTEVHLLQSWQAGFWA